MSDFTLRDAGKKMETIGPMMADSKEVYYPSVCFDTKQLPELSTWEVGGEYTLVIKVKEVSHEMFDKDGKVKESAFFDILKVGAYKGDEYYTKEAEKKLRIK